MLNCIRSAGDRHHYCKKPPVWAVYKCRQASYVDSYTEENMKRTKPFCILIALAAILLASCATTAVTGDAEALFNLGNAFYDNGDYDNAIANYTAALRIKPNNHEALYKRGVAYFIKGDIDVAIMDFTEAIWLKPDMGKAYLFRAFALITSVSEGTLNVNSSEASFNSILSGQVSEEQSVIYNRAIEDLTQSIRLDPDDAVAYDTRGGAYVLNGEYDRAIADYTAALKIQPNYFNALFGRGLAYYYKEDLDRAIADLEAVLRINPNDDDARQLLETARQRRGY